MKWAAAMLLGALVAGCVGTDEDARPEEVGTARSDCWWWGPGPTGLVSDANGDQDTGTAVSAWLWWGPGPTGLVAEPDADLTAATHDLVAHKARR